MKHSIFGFQRIAFDTDASLAGGTTEAAATTETPAAPGIDEVSILGSATPSAPAGENTDTTKTNEATGANADWQEYVNDDTKTAEENAALKAAHDATKPQATDEDKPVDPSTVVPEDGKYSLTMPEGVTVDQALVDALSPEFKDAGLTNGQAQKLADKFAEHRAAEVKTRNENWTKTLTAWVDDGKKDPEIGGDKWATTVANSHKAINALGNDSLKKYLDASGGGNHPELIRFMSKVGEMISEDTPPNGGAGGDGKKADPAHLLFPNDAPKG